MMITEALSDHPEYLEFADAMITMKICTAMKGSLASCSRKMIRRYSDRDTVAFIKRIGRETMPEVLLELTWRDFNSAFK